MIFLTKLRQAPAYGSEARLNDFQFFGHCSCPDGSRSALQGPPFGFSDFELCCPVAGGPWLLDFAVSLGKWLVGFWRKIVSKPGPRRVMALSLPEFRFLWLPCAAPWTMHIRNIDEIRVLDIMR